MDSPEAETGGYLSGERLSSRVSLLMFGVVAATCLCLVGLAHSQTVERLIRECAWEEARAKGQIPLFSFNAHFLDAEDRMCHLELPSADFSRGGVYLTGASNMSWAARSWDLPEEARPLSSHQHGGSESCWPPATHAASSSSKNIPAAAGGEKTRQAIGVSNHGTHGAPDRADRRSPEEGQYWTRRGFYTIDANGTIREKPLSDLFRTLIVERVKISGLLKEVVNLAYTPFKSPRVINGPLLIRERSGAMGSAWKQKIETETAAFEQFVEYLKRHQVKVVVIHMPQGSWEKSAPFESAYIADVRRICAKTGVLLLDYSRFLDDQDFADSIHLTPTGVEKFQPIVFKLALDHLRSIGALP